MKRLSFIFIFLLVGIWSFAQREPKELTFSNTVIMKGVSKDEVFDKAYNLVKKYSEERDGSPIYFEWDSRNSQVKYHYFVEDCPNFGLPYWIPGGDKKTHISFHIVIKYRKNSYTAEITDIYILNPNIGTLYGENGQLYPGRYTKKELKLSIPIIEYMSNIADNIFMEIKQYMTQN